MRNRVLRFVLFSLPVLLAEVALGQGGIPQDGVYAPPPTAAIDASDFYSEPLTPQQPSLLPDSDPFAHPEDLNCEPQGAFIDNFRTIDRFRFEYTFLGSGDLGLDEAEVSANFFIPNRVGVAPLIISPGFAVQWWDGPAAPDLPPRTYSAWIEASWNPQITPWFAASLAFRPGVYSDFRRFNSRSYRFKGSGLGIFTLSPRWQIAVGAVYLDRNEVKILPAGGFVWTPSDDVRWELIFPQPKLAQRLVTYGNTHLWWYLGGEYGGDNWTVRRFNPIGPPGVITTDQVDYNDIRVYLGFEWKPCDGLSGISGSVEVGYVFDRELVYLIPPRDFKQSETVMLRAALKY